MYRRDSEFSIDRFNREIEVWPSRGQQVPALPLMSVGQVIETYSQGDFRIETVTVKESSAGDDDPFDCVYVWKYEVFKVAD
jgi:hypothetical protein